MISLQQIKVQKHKFIIPDIFSSVKRKTREKQITVFNGLIACIVLSLVFVKNFALQTVQRDSMQIIDHFKMPDKKDNVLLLLNFT